jgi:SAM-dependent methyltransferase
MRFNEADHLKNTLTPPEQRRIQAETSFWDEVYVKRETTSPNLGGSNLWDMDDFFYNLIHRSNARRILSIGGGIDSLAVNLAKAGADVCSVDVSRVACERTRLLASQDALQGSLNVIHSSCEQLEFDREIDLVISKGVLHHINFDKGVARIKRALKSGGVLIAIEPICLSSVIGCLQHHFPFHPQEVVTADEIKLSGRELGLLRREFSRVEVQYFEFLSRPSLTYILGKLHASRLVPKLQKLDADLIKHLPYLRHYCQHGVIEATN